MTMGEAELERSKLAALLLAGQAIAIAAYVAWNARLLRPIADDYCSGVSAGKGLVGGVWSVFLTWKGDITASASEILLVGLPLAHLPWSLASALPFLFTTLSIVLCALYVLSRGTEQLGRSRNWRFLLLAPIVAVGWWGYWWLPANSNGPAWHEAARNGYAALASSIAVWQTASVLYAFVTALVVAALLFIWSSTRGAHWKWFPGYLVLGTLLGTAGLVLATATLIFLLVAALLDCLHRRRWLSRRTAFLLVSAAGIVTGLLVSYFSPGSQIRAAILRQDPALSPVTPRSLTTWVFPKVLVEWGLGLVNLGSITTVVLIASFALVLARAGVNLNVSALQRVALALLFYSMVLAVINRMSEAFSYAAFWHQISTRTVIFLALCALAASAGARGAATSKPWFTVASVTLVLLALLASGFACVAMVSTIQERSPRWESGPAPLAPHGDIEDPQGWIAECWRGLTDLRTSPQR